MIYKPRIINDVIITTSKGSSRNEAIVKFIRPNKECFNRSRRIKGYTHVELEEKIYAAIKKWYSPRIILYKIDGFIIGSNNKENALKEYWRICEKEKIKQHFEVELQ